MLLQLIRFRYLAILLTTIALIGLLWADRHVEYEQSIKSFFADEDPDITDYARVLEQFGSDNAVFLVYDDPELLTAAGMDRLGNLVEQITPERIPGLLQVQSLDQMPVFWELDEQLLNVLRLPTRFGIQDRALQALEALVQTLDPTQTPLAIGPAIRNAERVGDSDPERLIELRRQIVTHPLLGKNLVSEDGRTAAILIQLGDAEQFDLKASVTNLRELADGFAEANGLGRMAIVGPPVLLADGFIAIEIDGRRLAAVGMVLIGLVMLVAVRSVWWAIIPILAGWVVWLGAETIMDLLGLKLSLSGGPLVAQIIVLTMPAASHLAIHFRDDLRLIQSRHFAAIQTLRKVSVPILWCAVTGALGYGALLTSSLVPIRQFGAILGSCTFLASVLVLMITPIAMLPPFRLELPVRYGSRSQVGRNVDRLIRLVDRRAGLIVGTVLLVIGPLTLGTLFLEYETNYVNVYQRESRIVEDYHFVEDRLGGIGFFQLVVPISEQVEMATIERIARLDRQLDANGDQEGRPTIVHRISLATILDPTGRLSGLDPGLADRALAVKLRLIGLSPQADLLSNFWNDQEDQARFLIRIREQQPNAIKQGIFADVLDLGQRAYGDSATLTGLSFLMTKISRSVVVTQWTTLFWSAGSILIMLSLALRSARLSILALIPTAISVGLVLGLMGWLGIKLDLATALVASIALGLSVDDTFHCLLQYRRLRRHGHDHLTSLLESYSISGPGVLLSSLAVSMGFASLLLSEFVPFSNFGLLVALATGGSSLGNVILLPAVLSMLERTGNRPSQLPESSVIETVPPTPSAS